MPVGMTFVYNGYASDGQFRAGSTNGYGWCTNFSQRVDPVESVPAYADIANELKAEGFDYVWTDGDGTHHFFKKDDTVQAGNVYKDEDGLGLTLTIGGTYGNYPNVRMIEDKEGNKTGFFYNGYLMCSQNNLGQSIEYRYDVAKIHNITDGAGRKLQAHGISPQRGGCGIRT